MKKIILVTFDEAAKTYEGFSQLQKISKSNTFDLKQAMILQKHADKSKFVVKDSVDYESNSRVAKGGFIGIIVGILGGPLGVLCGWVIGDAVGLSANYIKNKRTHTIFDSIANQLDNDELGLLLYADESDETLLNTMIAEKLDGRIERFDYETVKEDVETAKKHLKHTQD
ncbi:hypothetical protein [Enterococcus hermanniensis]|uniref:DUF1269 domain-containing protein n=1 Tax=Enterococcus hermanniensis TaxID=249189 RepID=A0A1L8TMZ4_9ENTE|nr:hypothetical protein [Enterococcus hermanniensis]OJG45691.1 hypothetical protein RV04_GL001980 [Enterococcus hermanniensis]